ncbi:hypothetical protein HDC92_001781 [Pedobacter sp. AK017]|uniref:DKNYY domain-containing protein n=1 Tax=Pedobacter sp. AK017 TaxID=2723073 RepID=UPI001614F216|nr:DKNYY domain-containing protein [Pedobacter sp. AK017]MBB5438106.1 hypothetical protein [Pedobacter sp. AK017]
MYNLTIQSAYNEHDPNVYYWTDGRSVFFKFNEIAGADLETFQFYTGPFAKDKNYCYLGNEVLEEAENDTFEGINLSFAADINIIWCASGKVDQADRKTFEVCDSGKFILSNSTEIPVRLPLQEIKLACGYAKDKDRIYYFNFRNGLSINETAVSSSFVSLNDGYFGYDAYHIFCQAREIEGVDRKSWQRYGAGIFYSRDLEKVYYLHRLIPHADVETFKIVYPENNAKRTLRLASDKYRCYWNGMEITVKEFEVLKHSQQLG